MVLSDAPLQTKPPSLGCQIAPRTNGGMRHESPAFTTCGASRDGARQRAHDPSGALPPARAVTDASVIAPSSAPLGSTNDSGSSTQVYTGAPSSASTSIGSPVA